MVFETFRLILVPKPSKTTKSLPGEALNKNMASRVDEMQNFESRADETNAERHLGPANMPKVCECCSITSLREQSADPDYPDYPPDQVSWTAGRTPLPHAPGARMTVVHEQTPSNNTSVGLAPNGPKQFFKGDSLIIH